MPLPDFDSVENPEAVLPLHWHAYKLREGLLKLSCPLLSRYPSCSQKGERWCTLRTCRLLPLIFLFSPCSAFRYCLFLQFLLKVIIGLNYLALLLFILLLGTFNLLKLLPIILIYLVGESNSYLREKTPFKLHWSCGLCSCFTIHTEVPGCFNLQERQLISDFPSPPSSTRIDLNTNRDDWFLNLFLPEKKVAKLIQCTYHLHHFHLVYHPVRQAPSSLLSGLEYLKIGTLYGGCVASLPILFSLNLSILQVLNYRIGLLVVLLLIILRI